MKGYDIKFVQKDACEDDSEHLFTYIYTFFSPDTRLKYVARAECHAGEIFAVKFYCKRHRRSDFKYNRLTNRGYVRSILLTCIHVLLDVLNKHPLASFAFAGSYTVDRKNRWTEPISNTQRFLVYRQFVAQFVGNVQFEHFSYDSISAYLLINRACGDTGQKELEIKEMFLRTYKDLDRNTSTLAYRRSDVSGVSRE